MSKRIDQFDLGSAAGRDWHNDKRRAIILGRKIVDEAPECDGAGKLVAQAAGKLANRMELQRRKSLREWGEHLGCEPAQAFSIRRIFKIANDEDSTVNDVLGWAVALGNFDDIPEPGHAFGSDRSRIERIDNPNVARKTHNIACYQITNAPFRTNAQKVPRFCWRSFDNVV
jgi:hypothetical protein